MYCGAGYNSGFRRISSGFKGIMAMPDYVFPPAAQPAVAVAGSSALFPVRRIYCVGRNYVDHIREMGGDEREPPFFFSKPADALVASGGCVPYPPATASLHHEVELVVAMGKGGTSIASDEAEAHVFGYAVGNDITRRDLQSEAKAHGRPWDTAKGFDASAPVGAISPASQIGHPGSGAIWLKVTGELRQHADLSAMIWTVPEIIAALSRLYALMPGDLIFTGTPSGVGPMVRGDRIEAGIEGLTPLNHTIG